MTNYRDRNDGYVPDPPASWDELKPTYDTLIGNPYQEHHVTTKVPVAMGLADEYNRDPSYWWWAQVDPGSADGTPEHWSRFAGWDVRVGVELITWNSRDVNDWKGRDEIRKEGSWKITFNEELVYGEDYLRHRDPLEALLQIRFTIQKLHALPIRWREGNYKAQIEGRKIYYKSTPAVFKHWMPSQGAIMAVALPGHRFPSAPYDIDQRTGTDENPEHNYSEEFAEEAKIDLLSSDIWWWRDRDDF